MKNLIIEIRKLISIYLIRVIQKTLPQIEFKKDFNRFILFYSHLLIKK